MEFIQRGGNGCDDETKDEDLADSPLVLPKSAIEKRSEDRVLGEVSAFADNELNGGDRCVRNIGSEPAEEGADEPGGVRGREQIGRADEDENHPGDDR